MEVYKGGRYFSIQLLWNAHRQQIASCKAMLRKSAYECRWMKVRIERCMDLLSRGISNFNLALRVGVTEPGYLQVYQ